MAKKVLLSTLVSYKYEPYITHFLEYVEDEKENYSQMDVLITVNNSLPSFVKELKALEQWDYVRVVDRGQFNDKFDTIVDGRNYAIMDVRKNGYDILYYLDVDTIPEEVCIDRMVGYFNMFGGKVGIVGGNYHYKGGFEKAPGMAVIIGDRSTREKEDTGEVQSNKKFVEMRGVGFGFTMIRREVCEKYLLDRDFSGFGTEDYPFCGKIRKDGWKVLLLKEVRAKHLLLQKKDGKVYAY